MVESTVLNKMDLFDTLNCVCFFCFSPFPESGLSFSTLFCRTINVTVSYLSFRLRDFPQELLAVNDMHIWGRLIGAEPFGIDRGQSAVCCY